MAAQSVAQHDVFAATAATARAGNIMGNNLPIIHQIDRDGRAVPTKTGTFGFAPNERIPLWLYYKSFCFIRQEDKSK